MLFSARNGALPLLLLLLLGCFLDISSSSQVPLFRQNRPVSPRRSPNPLCRSEWCFLQHTAVRFLPSNHPLLAILRETARWNSSLNTHRSGRLLAGGDMVQQVPILGDFRSVAVLYAAVWVGTPPQRATAILDTGSTLLAFPCTECGSTCGSHQDAQWDASKSSTAQRCSGDTTTCTFRQTYAEGDGIAGTMWTDIVMLGGATASAKDSPERFGLAHSFGCTTS
jgi:hypothetical protein